jgi:hypothetical protein
MASVTSFIRNLPASSLRAYFDLTGILPPTPVNWDADEPEVIRGALRAVDEMTDEDRARVVNDGERVSAMADDAGQTALYSVIEDRAVLDCRANGQDRAFWLFLNEPILFRHAEEVRYTDEKRRGRSWDGFIAPPNLDIRRDPARGGERRAGPRFMSPGMVSEPSERIESQNQDLCPNNYK